MEIVDKLVMQQRALADFGGYAFREFDLQKVFDGAAKLVAECMESQYAKICRYRVKENDLEIIASFGWGPDIAGQSQKADRSSPGGRALVTAKPTACEDIRAEFELPDYYKRYGIVATVNVVIPGSNGGRPFGVLEIDCPERRQFSQQDINFLTGFANVVAEAVAASKRIAGLQRALEDKELLTRELNHRVRNNMHLIYSMLNMEAETQAEPDGYRTVANRVQALATVYDHLLGVGLANEIAFDQYLLKLCVHLRKFQPSTVELKIVVPPEVTVMLDLDTATAMGIALTELITNSYNHAFPSRDGTINVGVTLAEDVPIVTVEDDGVGIAVERKTRRYGLGLVRRLVEQVGGTLEIARAAQGTACKITLPTLEHQHAVRNRRKH